MNRDEKEINNMYYEALEQDLYVDLSEQIEHPPVALSMGTYDITDYKGNRRTYPVPLVTYGNFAFVSAPPKTYKSFFMSLLASAYLSGTTRFTGEIKGYRDDKDLYMFDTEQGNFHAQRGFRRVADMSGTSEGLHTFALRSISYKDRIGFIEWCLEKADEGSVGLVIIDGIADLVSDVNNIEETNLITQKIMQLSTKYNCAIILVIHFNYNSRKAVGHLGSFLEKKAETQIELYRDLEEDSKTINVTPKLSRNISFEPFDFYVNKYGLPQVIRNPEGGYGNDF
tara:strand:+ start:974 stop:1822 length:849 start_codon:yes stop_codon:yes gene_type:complete